MGHDSDPNTRTKTDVFYPLASLILSFLATNFGNGSAVPRTAAMNIVDAAIIAPEGGEDEFDASQDFQQGRG